MVCAVLAQRWGARRTAKEKSREREGAAAAARR
jgi:sodium/bile acid cotransporter 7